MNIQSRHALLRPVSSKNGLCFALVLRSHIFALANLWFIYQNCGF